MLLHAKQPEKPAGILYDHGTGKRIPFARKVDFDAGTYEYIVPTADGRNYSTDENGRLRVAKGKAVGRLELVPIAHADKLGAPIPTKVATAVEPMSQDQRRIGLEMYKECYVKVNREIRHKSKARVDDDWAKLMMTNDMFDEWCVKRRK